MIPAKMLRRWRDRLRPHIDTRGIITGVVVGIVLLLLTGVVAAVTGIAEDTWNATTNAVGQAEDVLNEKVRVWLALAVGVGIIFATIAALLIWESLHRTRALPDPYEVDRFDVLWPMTGIIDLSKVGRPRRPSRFRAEKPMCPNEKTPLGWVIFTDDDGNDRVVALPDNDWRDINADSMVFRCFACDERYDLRKYQYGMARVTEIVDAPRLSPRRTAQGCYSHRLLLEKDCRPASVYRRSRAHRVPGHAF